MGKNAVILWKKDFPKEEGWKLLGQVAFGSNLEWSVEDFCGTHLKEGQEN